MASLSEKRARIGLSRLARFASANGIEPAEIDDTAMEGFIAAVRKGSLHRKPNNLHRAVTSIWNEVARIAWARSAAGDSAFVSRRRPNGSTGHCCRLPSARMWMTT